MKIWCETCNGGGALKTSTIIPGLYDECSECNGKGYIDHKGLDEIIELGKAIKYLFESPTVEEYVYLSVGKHDYETLEEVIEEYKNWLRCEV